MTARRTRGVSRRSQNPAISIGSTLVRFIFENFPATASEFRAWKNTFLTKIVLIDTIGQEVIVNWVSKVLEEGCEIAEFSESGVFPRLDSHLGSLLMDSRHLKGELGMRFETYERSCQMARRAPRGRAFLHMIT